MHRLIILTLLISPAWAEVWKKPAYVPDENHIPSQEIQEQEERKEKQEERKELKKKRLYKERAPEKIRPKDP